MLRAAWRSPTATEPMEYLVRKPGYQDLASSRRSSTAELAVTLVPETDPFKLAEARPASSWLGALDLGDRDTKLHFQLQCTFCHQQGNAFIRIERTPEEWSAIIRRMVRYGSRLVERRTSGRCRRSSPRVTASCARTRS